MCEKGRQEGTRRRQHALIRRPSYRDAVVLSTLMRNLDPTDARTQAAGDMCAVALCAVAPYLHVAVLDARGAGVAPGWGVDVMESVAVG
jgi:hypothetical protein